MLEEQTRRMSHVGTLYWSKELSTQAARCSKLLM